MPSLTVGHTAAANLSNAVHQLVDAMSGLDAMAELPRSSDTAESKLLKVLVVGDVMLGRLVDQIFATHNEEPEHRSLAQTLVRCQLT